MNSLQIPEILLNSGHKMPVIGLGSASSPPLPQEKLVPLLVDAIAAGYRHLDTAALYRTEESVGGAVAESLLRGLVKSRDEIFITTKLQMTDAHRDRVLPALRESLRKLGLDYVDLYLIHWPVSMKIDCSNNSTKIVNFEMKEIWEEMEKCCRMGLAKSIGVSNFSTTKLSALLQIATIQPAVNQVEMNVGWQQQKMLEYCNEKGIHVSAYSPLGARGSSWGSNAVMENSILDHVAGSMNKTIAQVALRWIYEQGASMIVKSFNRERMRENLQVFDWKVGDEYGEKIKEIPQNRVVKGEEFVGPDVEYKSVEELWDGEI
ncbi:methylecgonone reductase-like [Salvia splendens]|uniref:methylecgonone reductase-like n=1 Tax=Salvia splendens TaxID=180675 RepID=UPI001C252F22|nr:methylecgonone reductase-like [Salvia splendens]